MIGLSILGVLLLVTVLTIWIFISVIKQAKRKGKNPYLHGGIAAIILFFLNAVFQALSRAQIGRSRLKP